jgi:hypothetical protein
MIHEAGVRGTGVALVRSQARPDGGMQLTPLRVHVKADLFLTQIADAF